MRIAVVSPHTGNNGNTTLAMLIALQISHTGAKTCITHSKAVSNSFYQYLNFKGFDDKTSTPTQIVKILKEGGLSSDDVSDYCKKVTDYLEAFTNNTKNFDDDDMNFMQEYIARSFPHEHIIFDIDESGDIEQTMKIIEMTDVVVLNINQSIAELREFFENKDEYMRVIGNKPMVVVVNKYNSVKGTLKETARWMGIKKPNNWLVLRENPWINWATNHGQLGQLYDKIIAKDPRVIDITTDITKIVSTVMRAKVAADKSRGGRKR